MAEREVLDVRTAHEWEVWLARNHGAVSRIQRFSRRKPRSPWSASNVERVQHLIEALRIRDAGLREFDAAKKDWRWP